MLDLQYTSKSYFRLNIFKCILFYRNVFKGEFCQIVMKIKRLSEVIGRKVFTDSGDLFGIVEEVNLADNKIDGWRIVVSRDSGMSSVLGGARGVIVPQQFLKAVGDVLLISKNAIPLKEEDEDMDFNSSDSM
jgi:sporulation protein YlmC with PRC-barrel domain